MKKNLRVVFVGYENILTTSISLPMELLRAADVFSRHKSMAISHRPKLDIQIASIDGESLITHTGLELKTDACIESIDDADIIFLPALWRNPFPVVKKNKKVCFWLRSMFSRETTLIAGVGTGCCFLAEAGLLDGKAATTHWYFFDRFQKRYPQINLQKKYFITQAGRIYCTGSVNTLADLTVHFISQFYSVEISEEVERHFFHDVRRGYAKLALLENQVSVHPDEVILDAQTYIQKNFSSTINFDYLAKTSEMGRRNFDRRFKAATGLTPLSYLQNIRMKNAKDLLKNSNLSIHDIVFETGYQDSAHFTKLFKKYCGVSPRQYRTTVRAKLFQVTQ